MLDLVSKVWEESKTKFLIVAIPVGVLLLAALFFKAYRTYLIASAKKLLEKTQEKDKKLNEEATKTNQEAEQHKKRADELAKKAKKTNNDDDPDWNKKI